MSCFKPLRAIRWPDGEIEFAGSSVISNLLLPCGRCTGCRLERSRQWAVRCMHEAKMHAHNCFLTLTYSDENLPQKYWTGLCRKDGQRAYGGNLHYRDVTLFLKRTLRALVRGSDVIVGTTITTNRTRRHGATPHTPTKTFRYYYAGEYGAQFQRPHYHLCVFGIDFADKIYLGKTPSGSKLFRSEKLEKLWPLGFSSIGEVNFESAAYVARYIMKKVTGKQAPDHYQTIDHETGEIFTRSPEKNEMSRRGGIGLSFLNTYQSDIYPHDYVIVRGKKTKPPRYYDRIYKQRNPTEWEAIEIDRQPELATAYYENQPARRRDKEIVLGAKLNMLKRKL